VGSCPTELEGESLSLRFSVCFSHLFRGFQRLLLIAPPVLSLLRYSSDLGRQGGYLPPSDSNASLASTSNLSSSMIGEPRLDWALERECEIVRLEEENKALREMLGLGPEGEGGERAREVGR